jgi:hypothetical protein
MSVCVHGLEISTCATCSPIPGEPVGGRRRTSASSDSLTGFFELLGAPLRNSRWSWGSVRERDGLVFLRVWEDLVRSVDGSRMVHVFGDAGESQSVGLRERQRQLDLVRGGATCYLVFCIAADPNVEPRTIVGFNARNLARGGRLVERGDGTWIEVGDSVPAEQVMTI